MGFIAETIKVEALVVEVVVVHKVDGQVAKVAGVDNGFDWVDGIAEVADRVDIHRMIGFS